MTFKLKKPSAKQNQLIFDKFRDSNIKLIKTFGLDTRKFEKYEYI